MSDNDNSIQKLTIEELQKRIQSIDALNISYDYVELMEATRIVYGISVQDWCRLLDISLGMYYGLLSVAPGYSRPTATKNLKMIASVFRFCYIFGYDISGISKGFSEQRESYITSFEEVALWFSKFSDETLLAIIKTVGHSNEPKIFRSRCIAGIKKYIKARKTFSETTSGEAASDTSKSSDDNAKDDDSVVITDSELESEL